MKKAWVLDPYDSSLPDGLKDEIIKMFQKAGFSNEVKRNANEDENEYGSPLLIKFLQDERVAEDEVIYILHTYFVANKIK